MANHLGSALDPRLAALLPLDRPEAPLEVAYWIELERFVPFNDLVALLRQRLPALPHADEILTRPRNGIGWPLWQESPNFSLARHVLEHRTTRRARPIDPSLVARLLNRPLPTDRPRWQVHTIQLGRRGALLMRVHLGWTTASNEAAWLNELLDPQPQRRGSQEAARPSPASAATGSNLSLREALAHFAAASWRHWRREGDPLAPARSEVDALAHLVRVALRPLPPLPFNGPLSGRRTAAWCAFPQAAIRRIRNRLGGTTWEVLLATALGGLSEVLRTRTPESPGPNLCALVAVELRSEQDALRTGQRVAFAVGRLPLAVGDPVGRLRSVSAQLDLLRVSGASEPLLRGVRWLAWAVRFGAEELLRERLDQLALHTYFWPFPPIRERRYCAGVPVTRIVPLAPLTANLGLVFGLQTYAEEAIVSFTADPERVCDIAELTRATEQAFASLLAAVEGERNA